MKRRNSQIACALIAAFVLAGCSASPKEEPKKDDAATQAPAVEVENDFTVQPGTAEDEYVGALEDVQVTSCESGDGGTQIAGTVTNPTEGPANYRIYVSIMNVGETLGIVQADVEGLAAGESAEWSKEAGAGAPDGTCVLRVERVAA